MSVQQLLRWQWSDYAAKHRRRANLLIHIVAVPLFQVGTLLPGLQRTPAGGRCRGSGCRVRGRFAGNAGAGSQARGGASGTIRRGGDVIRRIIAEQWVTFPRFVLSGGWYRNLKATKHA